MSDQEFGEFDEFAEEDEQMFGDEEGFIAGAELKEIYDQAEMLNDEERNAKYREAIARSVRAGDLVLDIGAGSGLLSLLAAQAGAARVLGVEGIAPLAELAQQVVADNGLDGRVQDRVQVLPKMSTALTVGPKGDLERKADVLVTEIFDSELLGEGILPSIRHARQHLLKPDCRIVPARATVWAALVDSSFLNQFHHVEGEWKDSSCEGFSSPWDVQFDAIPAERYRLLSQPFQVFSLDFEAPSLASSDRTTLSVPVTASGSLSCLLLWWSSALDREGSSVLSTAPRCLGGSSWRDHWRQFLYFLPSRSVSSGQSLSLVAKRDDTAIWFAHPEHEALPHPRTCSCGFHSTRRPQIFAWNDAARRQRFDAALAAGAAPSKGKGECLVVGSSLPLAFLARKHFERVTYVSTAKSLSQAEQRYLASPAASGIRVLDCLEDLESSPAFVISEMEYSPVERALTWERLSFWFDLATLRERSFKPAFAPAKLTVWAMLIESAQIRKRYSPVSVEGLEYGAFNQRLAEQDPMILDVDLWLYEFAPLSEPVALLDLSLADRPRSLNHHALIPANRSGTLDGVLLWLGSALDESAPPVPLSGPNARRFGLFPTAARSWQEGDAVEGEAMFDEHQGDVSFLFYLDPAPF